jgi:tetratricopeptide (TPR) repeat protein
LITVYSLRFNPEPLFPISTMNNLALALRAQGDLAGARTLFEQVLEISRRVLGEDHPNTSISAWNLLTTLREMDDVDEAMKILKNHLLWLIGRDPASIGTYQMQIREMIIRMFEG